MKRYATVVLLVLAGAGCGPSTDRLPEKNTARLSQARRLDRAERLFETGHLAEAEALYLQAAEPPSARAAAGLCRVLLAKGDYAGAVAWGRRAVELNPALPRTWKDLGQARLGLGALDEAALDFREAVRLAPEDPAPRIDLGVTLARLNILEDAETALREALALAPREPRALYNLGLVYEKMGRMEEAENSLRQSAALRPGFAPAYLALGNVREDLGDDEGALAEYRNAAAMNRELDEAWLLAAAICLRQNRLNEAEHLYGKLLEMRPGHPEASLRLGEIAVRKGEYPRAREFLLAVVGSGTADARVYDLLGLTQERSGEPETAAKSFQLAVDQEPGNPDYLLHRGRNLLDLENSNQALEYLEKASAAREGDPEILYFLGRARFLEEDLPGARKALEEAEDRGAGSEFGVKARTLLLRLKGKTPPPSPPDQDENLPFHQLFMRDILNNPGDGGDAPETGTQGG
ncbi:MAG TPA: tetratricopeptide repeat protein [bacterium]|nr:tetratricopeptide repeat protein [bacterium]